MPERDNGYRVLIVEDNLETQANLQAILELDGYQTDLASSVRETLVDRDWTSLYAIILDRRLPDGTADDLLPKLRELAPRVPVIVVTGYADLEGAVSVIRHGIADFIPKPINSEMLRSSLARVAKLREQEERSRQDERLATIGQMMASVAHESRNALQRILTSSELLELTLADDPEALKDVDSIRRAAGDLHAILEEIRCYAAPIQIDRHTMDVSKIWRSAWNKLEMERSGRDITLIEQTAGCNLQCDVDNTRLEQVFRNLFENSIAACGLSGTITVTCSDELDHAAEQLKIIVRDNGTGIDEDQRAKVFEPFFTTKPEGTGLGMAIAKRIIQAHGGRITVIKQDASPGAAFPGAAFSITLTRLKS